MVKVATKLCEELPKAWKGLAEALGETQGTTGTIDSCRSMWAWVYPAGLALSKQDQ